KREEIINSAIEKLDNACPRALQDPEQANAFIRHLIQLAVPFLSGMAKMKSWFTPPTENRLETFQVAAKQLTRANLLVFSGTPREIAAHIMDYLDNPSLMAMRLVSAAACDQAEKKLIPHCLKFDQLAIGSSADGYTYYEHVNIPAVRIKLENIARKEEAAIAQFVVTDNEALFAQFIRSLAKNKHVKTLHLDLGSNRLGKNTRVLTRVIQRLSLLPNLTSLDVDGNYLDDRGAEIISVLPNLMHLNIRLNQLGPSGAGFISRLSTLMRLEIGGNQIGDRGAESISTLSKLTDLEISRSGMGWRGVEFLSRLPKLTSLNIGSNDLGETGAETLSSLSNITNLSTGWNQLGKAGAEPISKLPNLTRLDIRSNGLEDTDTQFLSTLQNLTNLNIGWNKTGKVAGQFISTLPKLMRLHIDHNELEDVDAEFISTLPNLTTLDISGNCLTGVSAERIVKLKNIKNLDIRFNPLGDKHMWLSENTIGTI
ncbi:MAG: hypothetical protein K0R08_542, partial [Solimicrobium sp.]|nr:hypothetical protein [Solimicrobium sp.]